MVCTTVDTMVDTTDTPMPPVTDMPVTLARGLLMPNLMLMPLSTMVDTTDTLDTTVMAAVTTVMETVTTVMVDTDMDVSDTNGRFSQNPFKGFQNCIHPETKKMFFNIRIQKFLTIFMLKSI